MEKGEGVVTTTDTKGGLKKELLRTPFTSWLVITPNQSVYLQTKASAFANGFLYRIDQGSKRLIRVLGDIPGLTASISPKGTYILFSESGIKTFTTKLFITKTGTTKSLDFSVLPEKCVWLKSEDIICAGTNAVTSADYPDTWYMGTIGLQDRLYRILPPWAALKHSMRERLKGTMRPTLQWMKKKGCCTLLINRLGFYGALRCNLQLFTNRTSEIELLSN